MSNLSKVTQAGKVDSTGIGALRARVWASGLRAPNPRWLLYHSGLLDDPVPFGVYKHTISTEVTQCVIPLVLKLYTLCLLAFMSVAEEFL